MPYHPAMPEDDDRSIEPFEEWVEDMLSEIMTLLDELGGEVASLRERVIRLEHSAGRSLLHPSDLLDGSN
jgi:hypothetical protein